jgi:arylformamidase
LQEIVADVEKAICKLQNYTQECPIYICGHSAGAHLAAMMLYSRVIDFSHLHGLILVSGVYDLTPLLETDINDPLKMSQTDAIKVSPLLISTAGLVSARSNIKILFAYGQYESPAFIKQSNDYFKVTHISKYKVIIFVEFCSNIAFLTHL